MEAAPSLFREAQKEKIVNLAAINNETHPSRYCKVKTQCSTGVATASLSSVCTDMDAAH